MKRSNTDLSSFSLKGFISVLPFLTFLSGTAALVYETLWMRSFGLIFGNTTHAITVILSTYMGGMALGSFFIGRLKIKNPLRIYAFVEAFIGFTALIAFVLLQILPGLWGNFLRTTPLSPMLETFLRIMFSGLVILLPTMLMGATVPLLVEVMSHQVSRHSALSRLYYMNTLGGATGVLLTTYILFPALGLSKTYNIAIFINLLIAGICVLGSLSKQIEKARIIPAEIKERVQSDNKNSWTFIIVAAIVGATSFSLEVLWSRSFALVIGSSIYSFNLMLFSFLLGMVIGTWIYEMTWHKIRDAKFILIVLLSAIGAGILASSIVIGWLPLLYYNLMDILPVTFLVHQLVGFFLCFITMVIMTTVFGFIFPLLLQLIKGTDQDSEEALKSSARLYAWNTFGTLLGALTTGFILIPVLGIQKSYICAAALPLILALMLLGRQKSWNNSIRAITLASLFAGLVILGIIWSPWQPLVMTSGIYKYGLQIQKGKRGSAHELLKYYKSHRKILFYKEGIEGVVAVTQFDNYDKSLSINGKTDASTDDMITQKFLAYVPMALHPNPNKALVIGWGSGCTAGTAGLFPLKKIDAVEIEPAVFETGAFFSEINNKVFIDPRFRILYKDGRNVLLTTPLHYDVIISEPSNPWITGVSNLFTREFYKIGLSRLEKNGVFCQWFHIYDMPIETMQSQIQTFCSVFPTANLWIVPPDKHMSELGMKFTGDVLLIGSRIPISIDMNRMRMLYNMPNLVKDLDSLGIESPESFVSNALLDRAALLRFCKNAPLNTDDYPYVEFNAPRGLFQSNIISQNLIRTLYEELQIADTSLAPQVINEPALEASGNKANLAAYYENMGELYFNKGILNKAERLLKLSMQINPSSAGCAESLAKIDLMHGNYDEAIRLCRLAVKINPSLFNSWDMMGSIFYNLNQLADAKTIYQQIQLLFPNKAKGSFGLGMISYKEGNYKDAITFLSISLQIDPNNKTARRVLDSIRQL